MVLAERRLASGLPANLEALLQDITCSPIDKVGALTIDSFIPKTERKALAAALNSLLASPNFANWRQGPVILGPEACVTQKAPVASCAPGS